MKINWQNIKFTAYIFGILALLQLSQGKIVPIIQDTMLWLMRNIETNISFFKFGLVIIWILGITYAFWKNAFRTKIWVRGLIVLGIPLLFYGYNVKLRIAPVYQLAKEFGDKIGNVYVNDDIIGYKHRPNSVGYRKLGNEFITIAHDQDGNRIPVGYKHNNKRPLTMFLGCSVSYGDACWAEDAMAHLVAKALQGDYINAAGSGYGVSQMILKARELVPKYKPNYLIVQYTQWLPDRSSTNYQSFFGGRFPIPYISEKGLEMPVFSPRGLDAPFSEFYKTPTGRWDYLRFVARVAPNFVYQDINSLWVFFKQALGFTPKPSTNRKQVEDYAYGELYRICQENNTKMIVWTTGTGFYLPAKLPADTLYKLKVPIAYADSALYKRGNVWTTEDHAKLYAHWYTPIGQKDSVIADGHPNPLCHRITSEEILKTIKLSDSLDVIKKIGVARLGK